MTWRWWLGTEMKLSLYTVPWWPPPPTISKPCSQVSLQSLTRISAQQCRALLLVPVMLMFFFCVGCAFRWNDTRIDCFISSSLVRRNAFYIHEHFNTLTQAICSLVAVILPPGKLLKLTLCPHPSSIVCHCCAFMFMVLCTCNDCKCPFFFLFLSFKVKLMENW